ncbi:S-methyl-5'-thioadenosine phosphorylase [Acidobacteriota bacterium]
MVKIGVIGGSGLDEPGILDQPEIVEVNTPYGSPSSSLTLGKLKNMPVVLISRHGPKHTIPPMKVNFQANIHAMKEQGVTHLIVSTACGSLRDEIRPGDLVFPDQFIDRTTQRISTFFDKGQVCHIAMEEPFCEKLRSLLAETTRTLGFRYHADKTVITIEGPRFSTRAESRMYRLWGADIINMSTVPEVVLAREAGICYQAVAMATDYDCYRETEENVSWEQIVKIMTENAERVKRLLLEVIPAVDYEECSCRTAIDQALV